MEHSKLRLVVIAVLVVCIAGLVVERGGFFGLATCFCGLIASVMAALVWLRQPWRMRPIPLVPLLFVGLAVFYLLSAVVNGVSLTTLSETGVWAACAGISLLASSQDEKGRSVVLRALALFGILTAVVAIGVFAGAIPLAGGMNDGRLEFTFQYANASAAWFGTTALMCLLGADDRVKSFAALPVAAMLLTQSVGAIAVFAVVVMLVGVWLGRNGAWEALLKGLVQGMLGLLLFVLVLLINSQLSLLALVAAGVACICLHKHEEKLMVHVVARKACLLLAALLVLALAGVAFASPVRMQASQGSLIERLYHVRDGLSLWMSHPLVGVGPDNWQYLYPYIQTAPYRSKVVHSSFVQMLDDAGLPAMLFFVAACILGVRMLVMRVANQAGDEGTDGARGQWALAELSGVALLTLHSILEFDFQFGALAFLLAFLLSGSPAYKFPNKVAHGLMGGITAVVVCVSLCVTGLFCSATSTMLMRANAAKDYQTTERLFWTRPFALADPEAQGVYLFALFSEGEYKKVADTYRLMMAPNDVSVMHAAIAWNYLGMPEEAATVFIDRLERTPYDTNLLDAARGYARKFGIDPTKREAFDRALGEATNLVGASELHT